MHIADGVLPPQVAIAGYALTGGVTWYCLRKINKETNPQENIPKASLLTAAFFVASLIHIPLPPTSIHLILNGMMGAILGYYSFPAILIGLFFQAVMFGHGGLSTLGINAAMMGIPALFAYHIFNLRHLLGKKRQFSTGIFAFLAGAGALAISATIFTVVVITNISADIDVEMEKMAIYTSMIGYSFQALIEGAFTVMLVFFIERVKPELLES